MGIIMRLIIGALAGFIAGKIMGESSGLLKNFILGIVGGFVVPLALSLIGLTSTGGIIGSLVTGVLGACICIFIGRKLFK